MNIQKELDYLKEVTVGLLNKKGISFDFGTRHRSEKDGHLVKILIVNGDTSMDGNYQRIDMSYLTGKDTIHIRFTNNSFEGKHHEVSKEEAPAFLQSLLDSPLGKENKEISSEDDLVDFYHIFSNLSEQVFSLKDVFELNHWKKDSNLCKSLNREYNSLDYALHVHGGVGSTYSHSQLHGITTNIDFGILPKDGTTYLQVYSDIFEGPVKQKHPLGLYKDASIEMFVDSIIEQYKYACNRTK